MDQRDELKASMELEVMERSRDGFISRAPVDQRDELKALSVFGGPGATSRGLCISSRNDSA